MLEQEAQYVGVRSQGRGALSVLNFSQPGSKQSSEEDYALLLDQICQQLFRAALKRKFSMR